jgi:hypothetical protein
MRLVMTVSSIHSKNETSLYIQVEWNWSETVVSDSLFYPSLYIQVEWDIVPLNFYIS